MIISLPRCVSLASEQILTSEDKLSLTGHPLAPWFIPILSSTFDLLEHRAAQTVSEEATPSSARLLRSHRLRVRTRERQHVGHPI